MIEMTRTVPEGEAKGNSKLNFCISFSTFFFPRAALGPGWGPLAIYRKGENAYGK